MAKTNHTHQLRRHKYKSGNVIYFCMLPDCNYKISPSLAIGKRSLCHRCGEPFIMDEYSIRLAKPHCPACHQPKEKRREVRDDEVTLTKRSDPVSDLQSRLSGLYHHSIEATPDEEDI